MARNLQLTFSSWLILLFGTGCVVLICLVSFSPLLTILTRYSASLKHFDNDPYIIKIALFSTYQALLSSAITVFLAIFTALALHHHRIFRGQNLLLKLFSVTFGIPPIIVVLGLICLYGREGIINDFLVLLRLPGFSIYGLKGIILAHIFFNLPYITRILLKRLLDIPQETLELTANLGLKSTAIFKIVEWPLIRSSVYYSFIIVFLICFTSFTIIVTLGGKPNISTLEVMIYQAIKFDFNLAKASTIATIQFIISIVALLSLSILRNKTSTFHTKKQNNNLNYFSHQSMIAKTIDLFFILLSLSLILLPLAAILFMGLNQNLLIILQQKTLLLATLNSLLLCLASATLSLFLAFGLLIIICYCQYSLNKEKLAKILLIFSKTNLAISPFILATGFFIILYDKIDLIDARIYLIILLNAIISLPFITGSLYSPLTSISKQELWLSQSLGLNLQQMISLVFWPRIKRRIGLVFAMASLFAFGDFSIVSLFGTQDLITLPVYLYQKMGGYRLKEAASIAVLILLCCIAIFVIAEKFDKEGIENVNS